MVKVNINVTANDKHVNVVVGSADVPPRRDPADV